MSFFKVPLNNQPVSYLGWHERDQVLIPTKLERATSVLLINELITRMLNSEPNCTLIREGQPLPLEVRLNCEIYLNCSKSYLLEMDPLAAGSVEVRETANLFARINAFYTQFTGKR